MTTLLYFKNLNRLISFEGQVLYFRTHYQSIFDFALEQFAQQGRGVVMLGFGRRTVNPGNRHPEVGIMRGYLTEDSEAGRKLKCWQTFNDAISSYDGERELLCMTETWKRRADGEWDEDHILWRFSIYKKEETPEGIHVYVTLNAHPLSFDTLRGLIPPDLEEDAEAGKPVHFSVNL